MDLLHPVMESKLAQDKMTSMFFILTEMCPICWSQQTNYVNNKNENNRLGLIERKQVKSIRKQSYEQRKKESKNKSKKYTVHLIL